MSKKKETSPEEEKETKVKSETEDKEEKEVEKPSEEKESSKEDSSSESQETIEEQETEESQESIEEQETKDSDDKKDKKDEEIASLKDQLLRAQAEFVNFRNRTDKEKAEMFGRGAVNVIEKILPVIDNFERGLMTADDSPFAEGIKMIYKQLMTALTDMGVSEIKALGETFDPEIHNAVMHEENPDAGESEITEELQKGYKYNDTVVRHSMVKVAN